MIQRRTLSLAILFLLLCSSKVLAQQSQSRPLTVDDLFHLEELGETALSPDGQWLAYVVRRSIDQASNYRTNGLWGDDRADIWLASTKGGKPRNLTGGSAEQVGFWRPIWSPDGKRLALFSNKGGNVRLWLWEMATGVLKPLTDRGVELNLLFRAIWVSDHHILCQVLPEGKKSRAILGDTLPAEIGPRSWAKAWQGKEPTASVIESGLPGLLAKQPQGELRLIDVRTGIHQTLINGNTVSHSLSPDKHYVSFVKRIDFRINSNKPLRVAGSWEGNYQFTIADLKGGLVWAANDPIQNVNPNSVCWKGNGKEIAFIGQTSSDSPTRHRLFQLKFGDSTPVDLTGDLLEAIDVTNISKDQLLVLARPLSATGRYQGRADWWLIEGPGRMRNLTKLLPTTPTQLFSVQYSNDVVGLVEGNLWELGIDSGTPRNLTNNSQLKGARIVWPARTSDTPNKVTELILGVDRDSGTTLYRVEVQSGRIAEIPKPAPEANLAQYAPQQAAVFTADTTKGTYLWLAPKAATSYIPVLETNKFLRQIVPGELRKIEYRSLDGQKLKAWIILPPGYRKDNRYPLISWVYAGLVYGDKPNILTNLNLAHPLNLQLLAAHGYAVLLPSMPLKPIGEGSDPYLELSKGVLPAVEKAIDLEIADPERLGLLGHSYGGYTTYGLITQTNRFKAAVALAGISDLISLYGQFSTGTRYSDFIFPDAQSYMLLSETGQNRMGTPPWMDAARYVRNSPIFYAERAETPLMIIHGDMDFVGMQQAEEFFSALARQNRRATFVRYWGEGHIVQSPANIRDMWQRIYAWFDEFLKPNQK